MGHILKAYFQDETGNTVVEFAMIMPVMLLCLSGVFEISMFTLAKAKMDGIAGKISNIVSNRPVSRDKLIAIMNTANSMSRPFNFSTYGSLAITQIRNDGETADPTNMQISWQQANGSEISKLGAPGDFPTNIPNNIDIIEDQAIIVTELYYSYKPFIFTDFINDTLLYQVSVNVPRAGTMNTLIGEGL